MQCYAILITVIHHKKWYVKRKNAASVKKCCFLENYLHRNDIITYSTGACRASVDASVRLLTDARKMALLWIYLSFQVG